MALGIHEASIASTTYLTCVTSPSSDNYSGPATDLSSTYQKDPYNIVSTWYNSIALNVSLWNSVFYVPNVEFNSTLDAYGFCTAMRSECKHQYPNTDGSFKAWNNISGFDADIYVKINGQPYPQACTSLPPPSVVDYALGCADSDGFKTAGPASKQELQTYPNLIKNNNGSTWLHGTLQPNIIAPQNLALSNTFGTVKDASAFCNTLSAQCKAQFPGGNGSVAAYSPNNSVTPYPVSVTYMVSGSQGSANCSYFPP